MNQEYVHEAYEGNMQRNVYHERYAENYELCIESEQMNSNQHTRTEKRINRSTMK